MKKFLAPLLAAAALVSFGTGARADVTWTFDWNSTSVQSDGKLYTMNVAGNSSSPSVTTVTGTGFPGTSDIVGAQLSYTPNVASPGADKFSPQTFTLTGTVAGHAVSFDIGINVPSITFDPTTNTISVSNKLPWTITPTSGAQDTWTDGNGKTWSVVGQSITPGGSGNAGVGAISFTVTPGTGNGTQPPSSPEPSTMLLSCVGLAFGGFATWRKRKQAVVA